MTDIVKGLYDRAIGHGGDALLMDAADEIERLREANVRLQEALAADPMDQSAEIERLCDEREWLLHNADLVASWGWEWDETMGMEFIPWLEMRMEEAIEEANSE